MRAVRGLLVALGAGTLAFGVLGFARSRVDTDPASSLKLLVAGLVAHDALWAWAVAAASAGLVRTVPRRVRPVVMGALATSAVLTLVAIPVLTGEGRLANNPSILPRDYGAGLLVALTAVWAAAGALAVRSLRREPTAVDRERPPAYPATRGW